MRWILPEYIEDILPAEAMRMEGLRRKILDLFFANKYELVMPPLLEYMDSLLTGTGHDLELRTFKVIGQISGRTTGRYPYIMPPTTRNTSIGRLRRPATSSTCTCCSPGQKKRPLPD